MCVPAKIYWQVVLRDTRANLITPNREAAGNQNRVSCRFCHSKGGRANAKLNPLTARKRRDDTHATTKIQITNGGNYGKEKDH
jgi:hypothetical protein